MSGEANLTKMQVCGEMVRELEARINAWVAEKVSLLKASDRVKELDDLITEAKAHHATFKAQHDTEQAKIPKPEPEKAAEETAKS